MKYIILSILLLSTGLLIGSQPFSNIKDLTKEQYWTALRESNYVSKVQRCDLGKGFSTPNNAFAFTFNNESPWSESDTDRTLNTFESSKVTQKNPLLLWGRCGEGAISMVRCDTAKRYTASEAMEWIKVRQSKSTTPGFFHRFPTPTELKGIVENSCESPAANLSIFPYTKASAYWAFEPSKNKFYTVDFTKGTLQAAEPNERHFLRLVANFSSSMKEIYKSDAIEPEVFE